VKVVPLGEISRIVSGATPKTGVADYWDGDIQWATPADLSKLDGPYIAETPRTLTDAGAKSCATSVLPAGSVLLSSRAPIGHVAINTVPMATNQGFKSLVPGPDLDAKYLYHWLKSKTAYLQSLGNGATFKELSKKTTEQVLVPLPAIPEQRRIAAILDRADAIRAKRRQVLAHLDALTQSNFHDLFGTPEDWLQRWPMGTIGDLAEDVAYGTSGKAGGKGAWPILRMGNVTDDGRLDLTDLKYIDLSPVDVPKYTVRRGDMLFNRTNSKEKVGKAAVVRTDQPLALAGYLVRVRFADVATAEFVAGYLASPHGVAVRQKLAKAAVNQANISASEMRKIEIAHPPLAAKRSYAASLDAIEAERAVVLRALAADKELFASLQSRAFRGEL